MKRIEFIAPVESIRGNMSGRQDLQYPAHNNKAFDAPDGQVSYARNYTPRFIGAKVAKSGLKYFAVKTKTAVNKTAAAVMAMALQGATGALVGALLANKSAQPYQKVMAAFTLQHILKPSLTFRKFASDLFRQGLIDRAQNFTVLSGAAPYSIKNPWYDGSMTDGAKVSDEVLAKFWPQLSENGVTFTVDGAKGIAQAAEPLGTLVGDSNKNILGLQITAVGGVNYITLNGRYLLHGVTYVDEETEVTNGDAYTSTSVEPA